jgi:hypothetical protein
VKSFRFPLDRALHIRRAQLEIEQAKLQRLVRDREQLESQAQDIRNESSATRKALTTQSLFAAGEIATMPDYQRGAKLRLHKLEQQKNALIGKAQEQRRVTIEAERKVKLLEKLRSKRLGEWQTGMNNEQENFAADAYLARWKQIQ